MEVGAGYVVAFGVLPLVLGAVVRRWRVVPLGLVAPVLVLLTEALGGGVQTGRDWDVATTLLVVVGATSVPVVGSLALGTWLGRLAARRGGRARPAV